MQSTANTHKKNSNKYRACSRNCRQINKRAIIPAFRGKKKKRKGKKNHTRTRHKQAHPSFLYKYWALQSYRLHEPLPRLISCCQSCELFSDELGELHIAIELHVRALITLLRVFAFIHAPFRLREDVLSVSKQIPLAAILTQTTVCMHVHAHFIAETPQRII